MREGVRVPLRVPLRVCVCTRQSSCTGEVSRFGDNEDALLINRHLPTRAISGRLARSSVKILRVEVTFNGLGLMGCRCAIEASRTANSWRLLGDQALVWPSD